jgi:hypothetical protein
VRHTSLSAGIAEAMSGRYSSRVGEPRGDGALVAD